MYEQKMCATADKTYCLDKSVINTRTKKEPIIDTIVSVTGSFFMSGYWLGEYISTSTEGA